jgi:thiol-disulfide isomerase/thioredoxin
MIRARTLVIAAAGVCTIACGSVRPAATPQTVTASGGPTLTGKDVSLTSLHGHPVVLIFWASWCGPCHDEQPALNTAYTKWSARGVEFVGVDLRDDTKDALSFQSQLKVLYPSIADTQATLAVDYRIPSAPALVFLDAHGKVADVVLGALGTMSVADFNTELTSLLGAQSASA